MTKRNIYLENVPLPEALERWMALCREEGVAFPIDAEKAATGEAAGRVTSEPLFARVSSPPFHSSAMDGVALTASATYGASETTPVRLSLGRKVEWIDTGEPLPPGFDAVIMVEELNDVGEGTFEIIKPAYPWQNVRPLGEDIVETELVLPAGHRIRPVDICALLNAGLTEVPAHREPRVAIIPTGSELVERPGDLTKGKVMESNSFTLAALARSLGARADRMGLVPDDPDIILEAFKEALERADVVVINAGTSAGREDFTRSTIESLGKVAVHGVAMRPGKPVVLGVARGKPVIGLPGFPVANYRGAQEFMKPLIAALLGLPPGQSATLHARLARKVFSTPGFDEFVQVKVGRVGDDVVAVPLPRGSGVSMSLVRADGAIRVPAPEEGVARWRDVEVLLHGGDINLEGTILAIGSHDVSLDLLANRLRREDPRLSLASANVGSMGGIMAVKQGQAHVAGTHLLDPETGEFNVSYVLRQCSPEEVLLVHLAWREQGLMVLPGNPKGITGIEDLAREDVLFANRQKGSGTRLLLDYELGKAGIGPSDVNGYEREMFTHTAVAAAVAGGTADTGLGVMAAARALGLEFIQLGRERYDLLVLRSFEGSPGHRALVRALSDPEYRGEVEALGGYDLGEAGRIISLEL
ncbi:MAG: molybdopterin biosynthesis protein [Actinomycetia bacterium]|nr:molybdopterin biosynthesis protein [Actinomycetes bacterium]